ncbi:NAD(P)-binding protein [Dendrothele bispora CBS 962.96]|uniref:NAD(P)-binding protein n=1 Tax=Dendrothele bispora (strain CBS 962.96) TaxID=1314807 RepID=A0A4S8KT00_DENBC|nr:NAD(P)-binding protein [Dendrothele bispora CBS 962.96]
MPAIISPDSSTVLVTGANGFIATWLIGDLLDKGYTVKAAVRSERKGKHLLEVYNKYKNESKLGLVVIGDDMGKTGAFDEAVQGVDAVIHTAASVHLNAKEPREIINPAVRGVTGIMESLLKYGTSVKRLVITSSCAAICAFSTVPVTLSEENWNDEHVKECEEKGKDASPLAMYAASKTLAEKAGWEFYEKHKSELNWDLCFINPPWVFGPVKHDVKSIDTLNESNLFWYKATIKGDFGNYSPLFTPGHGWVDVREVSAGHIKAMETPEAGGERIIICAGSYVWQDCVDAINSVVPTPWKSHLLPYATGEPDGERVRSITWVTEKEKKILGLKLRTMKETARDILEDYERHGWA